MLEVLVAAVILVAVVTMVMVIMSSASNRTTTETANLVMQAKATKLIDEISAELRMAKADTIVPIGPDLNLPVGPDPISNDTFQDPTNDNAVTPINPLSGPDFADFVSARARCPLNSEPESVTPPKPPKGKVQAGHARYPGIRFNTMVTDSMKIITDKDGKKVLSPVSELDFNTKKPLYNRTVVYESVLEPADYQGGIQEAIDGIDNNRNGLIDERMLTRQEYRNNPAPNPLPDPTPIARNLRGVAFELPTTGAPHQVIIHVMFQDVDSKGKVLWYHTSTSVSVRN